MLTTTTHAKAMLFISVIGMAAPVHSGSLAVMPQWPAYSSQETAISANEHLPKVELVDPVTAENVEGQISPLPEDSEISNIVENPPVSRAIVYQGDGAGGLSGPGPIAEKTESQMASPDPITEEHINLLQSTGLIARQAAIAESIIVMERQLRQAELIRELMVIFGPDAPIEIAPGQYKTFGNTPAGRRIAFNIEEAEALARIRLLELEAAEAVLLGNNLPMSQTGDIVVVDEVPNPTQLTGMTEWPELLKIFGAEGHLQATLRIHGATLTVGQGDLLPNGAEVLSVSSDAVQLLDGVTEHEIKLGW